MTTQSAESISPFLAVPIEPAGLVPQEVLETAAQLGVLQHMPEVIAVTRELFARFRECEYWTTPVCRRHAHYPPRPRARHRRGGTRTRERVGAASAANHPALASGLPGFRGLLTMTGRDFITCAASLAKSSAEADLRSVVSRAYYLAFHEARALLHACGIWLPKTEQVHVKMGYCLRDCGDPIAAEVGHQLETLRAKRRVADYDLDDNRFVAPGDARSEVLKGRDIVGALAGLRPDETSEFRAKIRAKRNCSGCLFQIDAAPEPHTEDDRGRNGDAKGDITTSSWTIAKHSRQA